jgi:hypothetical protein
MELIFCVGLEGRESIKPLQQASRENVPARLHHKTLPKRAPPSAKLAFKTKWARTVPKTCPLVLLKIRLRKTPKAVTIAKKARGEMNT